MDSCSSSNSTFICSDELVCHCLQVTEAELVEALATCPIRTLKDIQQHTAAGGGCTACHRLLKTYLEREDYSSSSPICSVK